MRIFAHVPGRIFLFIFGCSLINVSIFKKNCVLIAQHRHRLSDKQLEAILKLLKGNFGDRFKSGVQLPANIRQADSSMRKQAGASMVRYDGCIKCHQHVRGPADKLKVCPLCGGSRYDERGHAREQVIHFPLKPRLEALLRDSIPFKEAITYEQHRPGGNREDCISGNVM